ncbi:MAG: putative signal peptide peptidase sppA [Chlamydiota bacterium]|jgi:protease-4
MEYMRESVILSSIRAFCKAFATLLGVLFAIVICVFALMFLTGPDLYPPKSTMTISPDAQGNRELVSLHAPVILKLDIHGVIGMDELTGDKVMNSLLDSREGMLAGDRVKAVLLHINSPGGTVDDADAIYRALVSYKKKYQVPVYAFVEGLCASGGMYIACAADKVFATPSSVIGSVGVILGPNFNFYGLMERYGVQSMTITQGKDKDALNPFRPWVPGEDASIRAITASLYDRFVDIVSSARPLLTKQKLVDDYGAQVFVASQAEKLGYIDVADANYFMAVQELTQAAHFGENAPYQVVTVQPMKPLLAGLTDAKTSLLSGKVTHSFQMSSTLTSELGGKLLYLYQPN